MDIYVYPDNKPNMVLQQLSKHQEYKDQITKNTSLVDENFKPLNPNSTFEDLAIVQNQKIIALIS